MTAQAMRRYLWVKDAAEAIWLLAEKRLKADLSHRAQDKFSNLEIAEKIGKYLGLRITFLLKRIG